MVGLELKGRSMVVTGASRGIGRETALSLAGLGVRLTLTARTSEALAPVVDAARSLGAEVRPWAADLSRPLEVERLAAELSDEPLHGLVHCAGVCSLSTVEETSTEALDLHWQVNLRAPYLLTSRWLPNLRRGRGHIVFVNSGAGRVAKAEWSAYALSKHGLKALAEALGQEVGADGVRVTTVYPGRTATDMQASVRAYENKPYEPDQFVRAGDVATAIANALQVSPPAVLEEISIRPMPA